MARMCFAGSCGALSVINFLHVGVELAVELWWNLLVMLLALDGLSWTF